MEIMKQIINQIRKEILAGKEGNTFMQAGCRYYVGVTKRYFPEEYKSAPEQIDWEIVEDYMATAYLAGKCFGYWVNEGLVYFDIVKETNSLEEAVKIGVDLGEIAIWDNKRGKEIILNRD